MSSNPAEASRGSPLQRPRHQITRSITELSSPIRLSRHHSHRLVKERDEVPHTAHPTIVPVSPPRISLDGPRSEGITPNLSPNPSRRASVMVSAGEENYLTAVASHTSAVRVSREEELRHEQMKAAAREVGLKQSMLDLSNYSNATTHRLDDTYYSVLEKVSVLQSTVLALKELAGLSHELNKSFREESQGLITDVSKQLDAFGQFEDQQKRVEALQGRIHNGREKVRVLSERVDTVRERIEGWERADREWQERTRRRLKFIWVVTSVIVFIMLLLFVSAQYAATSDIESGVSPVANTSESISAILAAGKVDAQPGTTTSSAAQERADGVSTDAAARSSLAVDNVLRIFDEL